MSWGDLQTAVFKQTGLNLMGGYFYNSDLAPKPRSGKFIHQASVDIGLVSSRSQDGNQVVFFVDGSGWKAYSPDTTCNVDLDPVKFTEKQVALVIVDERQPRIDNWSFPKEASQLSAGFT